MRRPAKKPFAASVRASLRTLPRTLPRALAAALLTALLAVAAAPVAVTTPSAGGDATTRTGVAHAQEGPIPFEEYERRVEEALRLVRGGLEDVSGADEARDLAADVNGLLPVSQEVRLGDETVRVDNSILRTYVTRLDSAETAAGRRAAARAMEAHLTSLSLAVSRSTGGGLRSDPATLERLLDREDAERQESLREALDRIFESIVAWLSERVSEEAAGTAVTVVFWAIAVPLVVLLTWALWEVYRRLRARRRARRMETERSETVGVPIVSAAADLPEDALAEAERVAGEGRYREAVRLLFGGAARSLVESGRVRQTRTLTDGELLGVVRSVLPLAAGPLERLTDLFERAWYGGRDPGEEGYVAARGSYRETVALATGKSAGAGSAGERT